MRKNIKIWLYGIGAVVMVAVLVVGGLLLKAYLEKEGYVGFEKTTIREDTSRPSPADTTFVVNDVEFKMVGVRGGRICCEGRENEVTLDNFYIGETEVTQELWTAVMGCPPSDYVDAESFPVQWVDLVECLDFVHKLDSITGCDFYLPSYPMWLYAAYLGNEPGDTLYCGSNNVDEVGWCVSNSDSVLHAVKMKQPNRLGIYDMTGNVEEWTISGSDPLFFVAGGNFLNKPEDCTIDSYVVCHAQIKMNCLGLRLVYFPKKRLYRGRNQR